MAAFVLPVVPPRTGGGGGAAASSPPRRRRHCSRPLPVVAVVVPIVRAAAVFEPDPSAGEDGGGGGRGATAGGVGSGVCRGKAGASVVGRAAWGSGLAAAETETVGTSRLSATTSGTSTQPVRQSRVGAGGGTAQGAGATREDLREVVSGDGDGVAAACTAVTDGDAATRQGDHDGKGGATAWSGRKHTASARAKISAANRGRVPWNKGRQHSEETRARIAAATRAAMNRPEVRNRMADKKEGRKHTPETRAKIRASCTARFMSSRKAMQAAAAVAGADDDGVDRETASDAPVAAPVSAKVFPPRPLGRSATTKMQHAGVAQPLPFSYDSAVLGPQVLAALPRLAYREGDNAAAGDATAGAWVTDGGSANGADGTGGSSASFASKRGPLSAETRAKLSRRIRDMWANDPGYRARVTAGIASRASGKVRQLSKEHREAIRQSLLSRNADLRERGVAHPSTRYADGQPSPRRRRRPRGDDGRPLRTPEEQAARAEARRLKRQEREDRRAARRAARAEEEAARRQSQKALVSQLVSAGSLPPLESLAQLDSWSGVPVEAGSDDPDAAASYGGDGAHGTWATPAHDSDAPDFDAIRAAGVSLQGRLRGAPDVDGGKTGGREELFGSAGATPADGSGVSGLAGGAPVDVRGGDAPLPPEVVLERIDYGDQLSFDLVSSPSMPGAADVLHAAADDHADDLLPVVAADATDAEDEDLDADSDEESDDDGDDWDDEDDSDDSDDSDGEEEEGFDFSWEYEVEPAPRRAAKPVNDAPVRKRILTYVDGAAIMVDSSA